MNRAKNRLIILASVFVCLIIAVTLSQLIAIPKSNPYSAENAKPSGVKALYLLFQKRGKKVGLWDSSYKRLPNSGQDTFMVVSPQKNAPDANSVQAFEEWIKKGNQLILLAPPESEWASAFHFHGKPCQIPQEGDSLTEIADIKHVQYKKNVAKDPWLKEIRTLLWPSEQCVVPGAHDESVLLDQNDQVLVTERKLGQGSIYYIPETDLFLNVNIDQKDNFILPLALTENRSGKIWFDETVHSLLPPKKNVASEFPPGNSSEDLSSPLSAFFQLLRKDGWFIFLQILFFVACWLYSKGKRFSAPRYEQVQEQRNSMEYVEAMSKWYSRSNLRKEALLIQQHELKQVIIKTFYLSPHANDEDISHQTEGDLGNSFKKAYEELIANMVPKITSNQKISHAEFMKWSIQIAQLRKEISQWKATLPTSAESKKYQMKLSKP